jgi:hypothetical protein
MWSYAAFSEAEDDLVDELLTPVPVRAGQAIVLDDALVHASPPNTTAEGRLAIQFVMVPHEADAVYCRRVGERDGLLDVELWRVDGPYFFDFWDGEGDARHGELIERIQVPDARFDAAALRSLVPSLA